MPISTTQRLRNAIGWWRHTTRRRIRYERLKVSRSFRRHGTQPLELQFANQYSTLASAPEIGWFADDVAERSNGAIRIHVVDGWARTSDRDEERSVVRALAAGGSDLAWVGTRVLGTLGSRALDPLQAPLLLADYEVERAACRSDLFDDAFDRFAALGLTGLAVVGGAMRKPFGLTRPLVTADDYNASTIRTHASAVGFATFRALAATPVLLSAVEMGQLRSNRATVTGLDLHTDAIAGWGLQGHVTWNVNLWPRCTTILANRRAFSRLGTEEQSLLRDSARRLVDRAAAELVDGDRRDREACPASVNVIEATPSEIAELRARLEPVYEELRGDPDARGLLAELESLAARG